MTHRNKQHKEGNEMTHKITRSDVAQAAAEKGVSIMEALSMLQSACAKLGDEQTLESLCAIKSDILFGDE